MDISIFLRGLLIGFSIAAPVGPIGVLCIRRTLADGRWVGLATGLGAATADATYGAIAAFGVTAITHVLVNLRLWIRLLGGLFLLYLGLKTMRARPAERAAEASGHTLVAAYGSALGLTLTNPATILSFAAIFAGLGAGTGGKGASAAALLVLGVFLGSALWWLFLSNGVALVRDRLTPGALRWVNLLSGCILIGFGAIALASLT